MSDAPHIRYIHMGQWPCYVGFTMSEKDFDAEMARLGIINPPKMLRNGRGAMAHYFDNPAGMLMIIVAIEPPRKRGPKRNPSQVAGLLSHESTHVVQEMNDVFAQGIRFDRENEAYLVGYLTQEFMGEYYRPGEGERRQIEPG